jgi:hypothetical protein
MSYVSSWSHHLTWATERRWPGLNPSGESERLGEDLWPPSESEPTEEPVVEESKGSKGMLRLELSEREPRGEVSSHASLGVWVGFGWTRLGRLGERVRGGGADAVVRKLLAAGVAVLILALVSNDETHPRARANCLLPAL